MFDNIIGQENIVNILKEELKSNRLPNSMLFSGEKYSAKLTTILELARILSCENEDAPWGCTCKSCYQQRLLIHPDTLILSTRNFFEEISACADVYKRTNKKFSRFMLNRAVRKLIRQWDSFLWEGGKDQVFKKGLKFLEDIEDVLVKIDPEKEDDLIKEKDLKKLLDSCEKLNGLILNDSLHISQVRNINYWVRLSSVSKCKVVIIDNCERMNLNSENALLKILEEPPKNVYFILLTTRKARILPTILSRLRVYNFANRTEEVEQDILKRIFREDNPEFTKLQDYFIDWNNIPLLKIRESAENFIESIKQNKLSLPEGLDDIQANKSYFIYFLEEVLKKLRTFLFSDNTDFSVDNMAKISDLINEASASFENFNQNPSLLLEALYYKLKEYV